jgi:pimeloyl-ACP methyl ester carboxylesterase
VKYTHSLIFTLLAGFMLLVPSIALPDTLVLIHGYSSDEREWYESGVVRRIQAASWEDAGTLFYTAKAVHLSGAPVMAKNRFYTVRLPSEAPIVYQSRYLGQYLSYIQQHHKQQHIILVGHSAGGVVARFYMVQNPDVGIDALITIASPHLGTELAELGSIAGNSPLGWAAPFIGGNTLNRSQGLYQELARERPGNMLFWLNRQEHPVAQYFSIIRSDDSFFGLGGDNVVPAWSQDLNRVQALRGKARSIVVEGDHDLRREDGDTLVYILTDLFESK